MWFLILFLAIVVTICAVTVWSMPDPEHDRSPEDRKGAAGERGGEPAVTPESLEGVLVAQLMSGEITSAQYQRAVEGLAVRDDDRHPLAVPPEAGPSEAA